MRPLLSGGGPAGLTTDRCRGKELYFKSGGKRRTPPANGGRQAHVGRVGWELPVHQLRRLGDALDDLAELLAADPPRAGEVGLGHQAHRVAAGVDHRHAADLLGGHEPLDHLDVVVLLDGRRARRHQLAHRGAAPLALRQAADDEVAVGHQPDQVPRWPFDDRQGAAVVLLHELRRLLGRALGGAGGGARRHDLSYFHQNLLLLLLGASPRTDGSGLLPNVPARGEPPSWSEPCWVKRRHARPVPTRRTRRSHRALSADRRLRPDRRLPDGRPGLQGRLARLALPPPLRQPGGLLRPPRLADRRPLLRPPARAVRGLPPLFGQDQPPGDHLRDPRRRSLPDRFHVGRRHGRAAARDAGGARGAAPGRVPGGGGRGRLRSPSPLRPGPGLAPESPQARFRLRGRPPGPHSPERGAAPRGRRRPRGRGLRSPVAGGAALPFPHRRERRSRRHSTPGGRRRRSAGAFAPLVGDLGRPLPLRRPLPRGGPAQHPPAEALDLRSLGRGDRRPHHLAPRGDRRPAQLGLPLLLAARCLLDPDRVLRPGLPGGGEGLPLLAPLCHAEAPSRARGALRRARRVAHPGVRPGHPGRLPRLAAGAGGQRRVRPAPARRLRRAGRVGLRVRQPRRRARPPPGAPPRPARRDRLPALAGARRRDLGETLRALPPYLLQDDVLGRPRPPAGDGRAGEDRARPLPRAFRPRVPRDPPRHRDRGLERPPGELRRRPGRRGGRRQPPPPRHLRLRRPAGGALPEHLRPPRPHAGGGRPPLPLPAGHRRPPRRRGGLRHLQLLGGRGARPDGRSGEGDRTLRPPPCLRQRRRPLRRADRRGERPIPRQLPPGLLPSRPDQRRPDPRPGGRRRGSRRHGGPDRSPGMSPLWAALDLPRALAAGFFSTVVMTTLMTASQGFGLSRMSLPFLLGSVFTPDRNRANVAGFALHFVNGWLVSLLYALAFAVMGRPSWWLGGIFGLVHGLFVLTALMPLLPSLHPRMATEDDGPTPTRQLEPPGFLALNYGRRTPLITLAAHLAYGALFGALYGR